MKIMHMIEMKIIIAMKIMHIIECCQCREHAFATETTWLFFSMWNVRKSGKVVLQFLFNSSDDEMMIFWDFYSGPKLLHSLVFIYYINLG